ncbi:MAG TPA: hypothetical protein H9771_04860 [Candidatus Faecalibacterium faecipullorum]|uniref:Uncharacterized protein n=1 Tax=Candidatus Faecalibacterium faecipullorum TaxID=2838578 RepID=A0A9D2S6N0_9FIRM|nr:hypothetical protein [Candidatus Faecalibacterium faecipullorum]
MMKTTMKRLAMFALSACVAAGGAVSSFAAAPASDRWTAEILGVQTNECEGTQYAELAVRFASSGGAVYDYAICGECGDVNGEGCLAELDDVTGNFSNLVVCQGRLDNGERVMTVSSITSGNSAMQRNTASVMLPAEDVAGYDLYLVGEGGAETKLEVTGDEKWAHFDAYLGGGVALIRMVER